MSITSYSPSHAEIVIFGASGDLSVRKLLPALYAAHAHDKLDVGTRILCLGRQPFSREAYLSSIDVKVKGFIPAKDFDQSAWLAFLKRVDYVCIDASDASQFARLKGSCTQGCLRVFYLATAPSLFVGICAALHGHGLVDQDTRIVLEKPLGVDLASAQQINNAVGQYFDESQIYRIDHYLGKETVQNLMVLRFGNAMYEWLWRAPYVRSVQITVAETVSVGSRARFYDGTGALRDMVQNHLLQLLCIVAMEPPISLQADDVRDEKLKVLRSLKPMNAEDVASNVVRGQYAAYQQEADVPPGSTTETFVALRAQINNARWANVPFFLRTGKSLATRSSEIVIEFAEQPFSIFDQPSQLQLNRQVNRDPNRHPNRLVIRLQPEESVHLDMLAKQPGSGMNLYPVKLGLDLQTSSTERRAEAYERLLVDVLKGRLTHFMRRDELEAAWRWIDPIQAAWADAKQAPMPYSQGSWGPQAADELMAREGLRWANA